jgi:inorganic pyrophosphatase
VSKARERNDRVVAVPVAAARERVIHNVTECSERARLELEQFFRAAVAFVTFIVVC